MSERELRECDNCAGHGRVLHYNKRYSADGYYESNCPVCRGTGQSKRRDAYQRTLQERLRRQHPMPLRYRVGKDGYPTA